MDRMSFFDKLKGHTVTILTHKKIVLIHCIKAGIPINGLLHDLSKFSPEEFIPSVRFYQGTRSPNEAERETKGFSRAWMHHKGRNKHHFEYWTDYDGRTKKMEPQPMPYLYVIEMFCDRVAAGKTYLKDKFTDSSPLAYFDMGRQRRNIHPETSKLLEELLTMLANEGEDRTFAYIRKNVFKYTREQLIRKIGMFKPLKYDFYSKLTKKLRKYSCIQ